MQCQNAQRWLLSKPTGAPQDALSDAWSPCWQTSSHGQI